MKRQQRLSWIVSCAVALLGRLALADAYDPPPTYYNPATGTGATLKSQLNGIIDGHTTRSYDDLRVDLQVTDADLIDPTKLRVVYNNGVPITKVTSGSIPGWDAGMTWNREHSWPQSRGVDTTSAPDGTDMFHLFSSKTSDNNTRASLNFGGAFGAQNRGTVSDGGTKYYPGDADAGLIARAQFYVATRYDGADGGTANLELVTGNPADGGTTMGDLNRLVEWHFAAPPDTFERRRNQLIYDDYQGNRNPFIDHPEYAWSIFVNQTNDSQISIAGATVNANGSSTRNVDLGRVFVNAALPAAQALTINKAGSNGTYFQITASGDANSSLTGPYNNMRTNQTDTKAIGVGLKPTTSTTTAGLRSGTLTVDNLDVTTGGGAGRGANDANDTFNVSLTVLDHATPSFSPSSTVTSLNYNFGNVAIGDPAPAFSFDVYNLLATAGYTAIMDFDSVTPSGNSSAFSTNFATFAGSLQLAGGAFQTFMTSFNTSAIGTFTANYTLGFSDENIAGALNKSITLSLSGIMRLAGDYNGDLKVDAADYTTWRDMVGQSVAAYSSADGDGNGAINELDYDVWRRHFGQSASGSGAGLGSANVPEPAAFLLALFVASLVSCGRARHS